VGDPGPVPPAGPGPTPAELLAGVLVAGSLVETTLLAGAEVGAPVVVAAVVVGAAVVVDALVLAAVVGGAAVVVGWSARGVPPVVVGCATTG